MYQDHAKFVTSRILKS